MKISFCFFPIFLFAFSCYSQISLPKGFKCVSLSAETNMRDNYFSDGTFRFHSEAWGREIQEPADLKDFIQKGYEGKLMFKKTQDNLYWATGIYKGEYKYVIIVPEDLSTIVLSSKTNGSKFSNYSAWLLQQVRINISSKKEYYFTDFKGKSCSE